jgi:hypothetical protein
VTLEIGKRLPRALVKPHELQPGEYCVIEVETMAGITKHAYVRCPDCGAVDELGPKYEVLPYSGIVTPRWHCQTTTCGCLTRLTLDAWEAS